MFTEARRYRLRRRPFFAAVLLLGAAPANPPANVQSARNAAEGSSLDCKQCHRCPQPTANKPCLQPCPTLTAAQRASPHTLAEAPGRMVLDKLSDVYQGAVFQHKTHAAMAGMAGGCPVCHHFSPPGKIQPCVTCHDPQGRTADLRQPGLKGAYHRQCLQCHREWSHETDCSVCHQAKDVDTANTVAKKKADATDIMGHSHPEISTPDKRVYTTPYPDGPIVTFYHQEHVDLFGLKCVNCHHQENCGYCHDLNHPAAKKKTMVEVHAVCSTCHKADNCAKCHDKVERPTFSHAITGWPLGRYHQQLSCRACHPTGSPIQKLSIDCKQCHGGWNQDNFRHAAVGLALDGTHSGVDCDDCHPQRRFDKPPACANCHDDARSYLKMPPGAFTAPAAH